MSADNYNLVKRLGDTWRVWLNLSASNTRDQALYETAPARDFTDMLEAVEWADAQGYTEYGTEIDDREPGVCSCYARMAGECCCGAWDEPIAARSPDHRDAELASLRGMRDNVDEAYNHLGALNFDVGDVVDQEDIEHIQRHAELLGMVAPERYSSGVRIAELEAALAEACDIADHLMYVSGYDDLGEQPEGGRIAALRLLSKPVHK